MKKYLAGIFATILVFTVACSEQSTSQESNGNKESVVVQGNKDSTAEEAKAEVASVKYYKWLDEAVDSETITVYAEIKNTGDTDIYAGYAKLTFLDTNGKVISATSEGGQIAPRIIKAGSVGYVSTEVHDDISKYEDLDKVEIEVSPETSQAEVIEFKTKDTNLNVGKWREENSKVSVTGFLENESDVDFSKDDTSAIIGLYDEDDNFLAAESMYIDQEFSIDAKGETSFEVGGGSPLPSVVGEKIKRAEVKAIGIENIDD